MALTVGSVIAKFQSDVTDFKKGLSEAKSEVSDFGNSIASSMKNAEAGSKAFATALAVGVTALAGFVGYGAKVAGDLESARQGFVALLGSAEKADAVMARIKIEAAATPFELPGLVAGTQALAAITKDGDLAIDTLLDVGKAIATSGKGQAELDRVIINLQQIASTGKLTAMDIRQFQGAIPIFNDIVEASGHTVAELQDADNAAELLFEAFKKAGAEGGMTAAGFTSQAGTFNQLTSNLKDNFTILGSEIVKQTGAFDLIKGAIEGINKVLGDQDSVIGGIKGFLEFLQKYGVIVAGAIVGALVPAFVAWAASIWAALAPLLPFIAIGAAVGAAIWAIINVVKNWGAIMDWLKGVWEVASTAISNTLTTLYESYIKPILEAVGAAFVWLWETAIKPVIDMIVAYYKFWYDVLAWVWNNLIYPILYFIASIFARIFYEIFMSIKTRLTEAWEFWSGLFTEIWNWIKPWLELLSAFIGQIWEWIVNKTKEAWSWIKEHIVSPITEAKNKVGEIATGIFNYLSDKFTAAYNFVKDIWQKLKDAIVGPFEEAKRKVEQIAQAIKDAADKINPFHRESPSLVDNVKAGVKAIEDAYSGLGLNLNGPSITQSGLLAGVGSGGNIIQISLAGANISDPSVAESYAEIIGDLIMRKLSKTARVV